MTLLEFCKAVAEGKALQCEDPFDPRGWVEASPDQIQTLNLVRFEKWRLKPEAPTPPRNYRPWTFDEVQVGAVIRSGDVRTTIQSVFWHQGRIEIGIGMNTNLSPEQLFKEWQFNWKDGAGGTSWQPCGTFDLIVVKH